MVFESIHLTNVAMLLKGYRYYSFVSYAINLMQKQFNSKLPITTRKSYAKYEMQSDTVWWKVWMEIKVKLWICSISACRKRKACLSQIWFGVPWMSAEFRYIQFRILSLQTEAHTNKSQISLRSIIIVFCVGSLYWNVESTLCPPSCQSLTRPRLLPIATHVSNSGSSLRKARDRAIPSAAIGIR